MISKTITTIILAVFVNAGSPRRLGYASEFTHSDVTYAPPFDSPKAPILHPPSSPPKYCHEKHDHGVHPKNKHLHDEDVLEEIYSIEYREGKNKQNPNYKSKFDDHVDDYKYSDNSKYDGMSKYDEKMKYDAKSKYDGSKYEGSKYEGSTYDGSKYDGTKYDGAKYDGSKYDETKYEGSNNDGSKYAGSKYHGSKYDEHKYDDGKYDTYKDDQKYHTKYDSNSYYDNSKYDYNFDEYSHTDSKKGGKTRGGKSVKDDEMRKSKKLKYSSPDNNEFHGVVNKSGTGIHLFRVQKGIPVRHERFF